MSLTALQLASFVADLEDFFVHERHVLEDLRERTSEGGSSFKDGLLLGASSLQSIFEVERDIDLALYRLEKALRPLQLDSAISSMRRRDLFSTRNSPSFHDSLEESFALLRWRGKEMEALREHLLQLGEEEIEEAFSKKADDKFQERLERDLQSLLEEGNL